MTIVRRSLGTRDPEEAARTLVATNAAIEEELDRARAAADARLTRDETSSERAAALIAACDPKPFALIPTRLETSAQSDAAKARTIPASPMRCPARRCGGDPRRIADSP